MCFYRSVRLVASAPRNGRLEASIRGMDCKRVSGRDAPCRDAGSSGRTRGVEGIGFVFQIRLDRGGYGGGELRTGGARVGE